MNSMPLCFHSHQYALPVPHLLSPSSNTSTQMLSSPPPGEPSINVASLTLETSPCPQCKGRKYGFTAYFHNKGIFPTLPHTLLPLIEASYVPKNRLKSLLLNYATRSIDPAHLPVVDAEIKSLERQVEDALEQVKMRRFVSVEVMKAMSGVQNCTRWTIQDLTSHIWGISRFERGRAGDITKKFKGAWEELWRACLMEEARRSRAV